MTEFGFLVHQTSSDPWHTWRKMARRSWKYALVPPHLMHYVILPRIPLESDKLMMGRATGIVSPGGRETKGVFRALPYTTDYMVNHRPVDQIVEAGRLCLEEGVKVIGLGAYTSIVSENGRLIAEALRDEHVAVTTGNSLTAWAAVEGLATLCIELGIRLDEQNVAVIGAGGNTGKAVCNLLKGRVGSLRLVGSGRTDLRDTALELGLPETAISYNVNSAITQCNLVVSATNSPDELRIEPRATKQWKVFVDVARPRDISRVVADLPHVLTIDGGLFRVPGEDADLGWDFDFPPGLAYACMTETMVLAMLGHTEHHVGDLDPQFVRWIGSEAIRLGFRLAGWRSLDRALAPERITAMRELIARGGTR